MSISERPAIAASGPAKGGRRRPPRTPKGRQVDLQALEEVRALLIDQPAPARSADRAPAPDPGPLRPSLRGASHGAGERDEACAHRGLRGRDLLRAFRRGEGRRDAAAGRHRARVRFIVVRACRRRTPSRRFAEKARRQSARRACAVHGRLRPRAGLRRRPCASHAGRCRKGRRGRSDAAACARLCDAQCIRCLRAWRRL